MAVGVIGQTVVAQSAVINAWSRSLIPTKTPYLSSKRFNDDVMIERHQKYPTDTGHQKLVDED